MARHLTAVQLAVLCVLGAAASAVSAAESTAAPGFVDSEAIEKALGGEPLELMGPGGQREARRLPLRVEFDTDRDTIRADAEAQIEALGEALERIVRSHPDAAFVIEGHTDQRGSDAHNDALSLRRARTVARTLAARFQIPSDHLAVQGFGERRPIARGDSAADYQMNRRVEVVRREIADLAALSGAELITTSRAVVENPSVQAGPAAVSLEAAVFYEDAESRPRKLRENTALRSGDGYRIYFRPQKNQYLYVIQQDATERVFALFPNPEYGYAANQVEAGKEYWIPQDKWLELDQERGSETIFFIASSKPRGDIEAMLRRAATESRYEIKPMGAIVSMGVKAQPRAGRVVQVAAPSGATSGVGVDALIGQGVDLVHKVTFRHE